MRTNVLRPDALGQRRQFFLHGCYYGGIAARKIVTFVRITSHIVEAALSSQACQEGCDGSMQWAHFAAVHVVVLDGIVGSRGVGVLRPTPVGFNHLASEQLDKRHAWLRMFSIRLSK